jgi:hypothetical protein
MNYSFIDKYKSSDFIPQSNSKLYNEVNNNTITNTNNNTITNTNTNKNQDNYYWSNYSQNENNWATENSIQKSLLKGVYQPTPLGELFFSQENIKRVQKMIIYEVFVRTNGKYKLETEQNETDLLVVMRDIYITCGKNMPFKIIHQVKELNHKTIEKILPDMISMIKQDDEYVKQLDKPIDPIPLPVCVNSKGRLTLPSVTTTFFNK